MTYQVKKIGDHDWQDDDFPGRAPKIMPGYEYRIKPLPAAPKWPQTTMTELDLCHELTWGGNGQSDVPVLVPIANAAIAHACVTGQVLPIGEHNARIEAQVKAWKAAAIDAQAENTRLEKLLDVARIIQGSGIKEKTMYTLPLPRPYILEVMAAERDMAIAINVRAACHAKLPGQVSNEELKTLIDLAK